MCIMTYIYKAVLQDCWTETFFDVQTVRMSSQANEVPIWQKNYITFVFERVGQLHQVDDI